MEKLIEEIGWDRILFLENKCELSFYVSAENNDLKEKH